MWYFVLTIVCMLVMAMIWMTLVVLAIACDNIAENIRMDLIIGFPYTILSLIWIVGSIVKLITVIF